MTLVGNPVAAGVVHTAITVPDVAQEPNYDEVIAAARSAV